MDRISIILMALCLATAANAQSSMMRQPLRQAPKAELNISPVDFEAQKAPIRQLATSTNTVSVKDINVTSGDMDPKRLTYVAPDEYYNFNAFTCYMNTNKVGIYTHFTKDMVKRFAGNRLKNVNMVVDPSVVKVNVRVMDSDLNVIEDTEATLDDTSFGWGYVVSADSELELTGDDIYVGFVLEYPAGTVQYTTLLQSGRAEPKSMLVDYYNDDDLMPVSEALAGVPVIWCETEGESGLYANDVLVSEINGYRTKSGSNYSISGSFINIGTNPVRYVTVQYETSEGVTNDITLDAGEPLPYMNKIFFNMPMKAEDNPGIYLRNVTVTAVNGKADDYSEDNAGTSLLFSIADPMQRNVAVEEFTGAWCGYCTRGIAAMKLLDEMYGDRVVHMELHCMDNAAYEEGDFYNKYSPYIPGWPHTLVNRMYMSDPWFGIAEYEKRDFGMGDEVGDVMNLPVEVGVNVNATLSPDKSVIYAKTEATFSFDVDELSKYYTIGYMLLEDGIMSVQNNYYSGSYAGRPCERDELPEAMQPFFDLPESYVTTYNHVVREEIGALGIENSLTGSISKGGKAYHEIEIPTTSIINDAENAVVAAFVLDKATGEILNISTYSLKSAGISDISIDTPCGEVEYYTTMGIKLDANRLPKGEVLIVKDNEKTYKTIVR